MKGHFLNGKHAAKKLDYGLIPSLLHPKSERTVLILQSEVDLLKLEIAQSGAAAYGSQPASNFRLLN